MRTAGILLAAGRASRFGSPKMLAPFRGKPLLLHALEAFVGGGLGEVVVVVAPGAVEVAALATPLGAAVVENPDPSRGMLSSVQAGLAALRSDPASVAVSPADIPGISAAVVVRLLAAAAPALAAGALAVPVAAGRRGHPLLLPAAAARRLAGWDPGRRLSDLLREPGTAVHEVDGFGDEVLRDVDRPSDLA